MRKVKPLRIFFVVAARRDRVVACHTIGAEKIHLTGMTWTWGVLMDGEDVFLTSGVEKVTFLTH